MASVVFIGLINYLIFFWMNKRRNWKKEDRLALKEARYEALEEFRQSQETIEEFMTRDYTKPVGLKSVSRRPVLR